MMTANLAQMGPAQVTVVDINGKSCIRKQGASPVELNFYQFSAPQLDGVNTPRLLDVKGDDLYIEYIPNTITLDELLAQNLTFEQLARIHQSDFQPTHPLKQHHWTESNTDLALNSLNLPQITNDSLRTIQHLSQDLFSSQRLVSGDTNQGNWGIKHNGELVLFDWERFGFGSPAIDLAPLIKGLGSLDDYEWMVGQYTLYNPQVSGHMLVKQLILAKAWLIIEVTNILVGRNNPHKVKCIHWYQQHIPQWLAKVEKGL
ncbi:phosphotransferase [Vibrio ostreicida]|uniref:phosphotransferase n=1 Tax=Vibrio ostreicida TaxID=526588 RepID=UPI003B5C537A